MLNREDCVRGENFKWYFCVMPLLLYANSKFCVHKTFIVLKKVSVSFTIYLLHISIFTIDDVTLGAGTKDVFGTSKSFSACP